MSSPDDEHIETRDAPREAAYRCEYCKVAEVYYRLGGTDVGLAEALGTDAQTLQDWQHHHPELAAACDRGKSAMNDCVERSAFLRASGYDYTAEHPMNFKGIGFVVPYRKHVPADVGFAKLWLMNRKPGRWKQAARISLVKTPQQVWTETYEQIYAPRKHGNDEAQEGRGSQNET